MASSGIVILCSVIFFLKLQMTKSESFVTVDCKKTSIIAQHGTKTLLDCAVRARGRTFKIDLVNWKFQGSNILFFENNKIEEKKPGYEFMLSYLDDSNVNVSLLITNTSLTNAGKYKCDVLTSIGMNEAEVHLTVKSNYSKPEIRKEPEKVTTGQAFTLTCLARGGYPKGNIRWIVDEGDWKKNPIVKTENNSNGLLEMTSTLSFGPESNFGKFVCEVYNEKGEKESQQELQIINDLSQQTGNALKEPSHIVAPVVVIGSLIVGLLAALLLCRKRRQQDRPNDDPEEQVNMA